MTHTAVGLLVLLGFLVGLLTGYVLARSVHVDRRPVDVAPNGDRETVGAMRSVLGYLARLLARPGVAATLLVIALLLSASGAFLNVQTSGKVGDVVDCFGDYNRAAGEARDERGEVARKATRSELRLWVRFRAQLGATGTTVDDLLATIDRRIARLREVLTSQTANPYPRPDSCDDRRFDDNDTAPQEAAP